MHAYRWRGFLRYMEADRGFGGWLAFFFISLVGGIAAQGYWLVQGGGSLHAWSTSDLPYARYVLALEAARTVIHAGIFCALLIGLWLFANEDRRTPAYWTGYFAAVIPIDVAFSLLGAALSSRISGESFATAAVAHLVGTTWPIVFAVAWGLYWRRSRRVRNTYGYTGWRWPPPNGELEYWPS